MNNNDNLRNKLISVLHSHLERLDYVLAGWEGGSVAFNAEDEYSDIDLNFLLNHTCSTEHFYGAVKSALHTVSPIIAEHSQPPGRYFKLEKSTEFLLVDVCIFQTKDLVECLNVERHGQARPLFDKGAWLQPRPLLEDSHAAHKVKRLTEHQEWFSISQNFVRKAIFRGRDVEAFAAYWGYTIKPLVEILRMRHCPARWDFGLRDLERDLPLPIYNELCPLIFVESPDALAARLPQAIAWAEQLLREIESTVASS